MIAVALAFVGMMVWGWGMDITGTRSGVSAGIIGKINGEEIPYTMYDNIVRSYRQNESGNRRTTYADERRIHQDAWDYIITQKVISQEIKRLGITFTDKELVQFMLNNPPQIAYQVPVFMDDNTFNIQKYQAFLQNPSSFNDPQLASLIQYIENESSAMLPQIKLQQYVTGAIVVTDDKLREMWLRDNEKREVDWFFVPATTVTEVGTQLDPAQVQDYYTENKEKYRKDERRLLTAVFMPLVPTAADSAEVLDLANMIVVQARGDADFSELANQYTDDPGNTNADGSRNGGELGFFGRGRMVPEFENAAFALKPGEVSDPVISRFGCHIIKVDSLKYSTANPQEVEQIKARHILMNIEPSGQTRDAVIAAVQAFHADVTDGMDFADRARQENLDVITTLPFEKDATGVMGIPGNTSLLISRAFHAKPGDVFPTYPTDGGNYIIMLESILAPGIPTVQEVESEVASDLRNKLRAGFAEETVKRIDSRMKSGMTLADAVAADDYKKIAVRAIEMTRNFFVPGLMALNPLTARVFTLGNPGESTGAVVTDAGSGIAVLKTIVPIDEAKYEQDKEQLRKQIMSQKRNELLNRYIESLRDKAKIVDSRYVFLNY